MYAKSIKKKESNPNEPKSRNVNPRGLLKKLEKLGAIISESSNRRTLSRHYQVTMPNGLRAELIDQYYENWMVKLDGKLYRCYSVAVCLAVLQGIKITPDILTRGQREIYDAVKKTGSEGVMPQGRKLSETVLRQLRSIGLLERIAGNRYRIIFKDDE